MTPAATAELRQQGKQSSETAITRVRTTEIFVDFLVGVFFSPLVSLYLGPDPGCQRGFGVSVHSLGSCLILASKLGLQLPCPVVPGELDGLVTGAVNWAAA